MAPPGQASSWRGARRAAWCLLAVSAGVMFAMAGHAVSGSLPPDSTAQALPQLSAWGIHGAPAVWLGDDAYIIRAPLVESNETQVLAFNPTASTLTIVPGTLPVQLGLGATAAAVDGRIYVFGGANYAGACYGECLYDKIRVFDPAAGTFETLPVTLPYPTYYSAAVTIGAKIYLFGGITDMQPNNGEIDETYSNAILEFDAASETITTLSIQLPSGTAYERAVWTGQAVYIFEGYHNGDTIQVWKFVPANAGNPASVTVVGANLPSGLTWSSAIWDGASIFVMGGSGSDSQYPHAILRFDPESESLSAWPNELPRGSYYAAYAFDPLHSCAYIFGGYEEPDSTGNVAADNILAFGGANCHVQPSAAHAVDDSFATAVNTGFTMPGCLSGVPAAMGGPYRGVLCNDADPQNHTLSAVSWIRSGPPGTSSNSFATTADGGLQYWPPPNYCGPDQLQYTLRDVTTNTVLNSVPVNITVTCPPPPPPPPPTNPPPPPQPPTTMPTAVIGASSLACRPSGGLDVQYSGGASQPGSGGPIVSYEWVFEDGSTATGMISPSYFLDDYSGQITLTVTDQAGNSATESTHLAWLICPDGESNGTDPEPGPTEDAESSPSRTTFWRGDSDQDGIADAADNCPSVANRDQTDSDRNGIGDACQTSRPTTATDSMARPAVDSTRPDGDHDLIPDALDDCPEIADPAQNDFDRDGIGDACDADLDGDGVLNMGPPGLFLDDCPTIPDLQQTDTDGDGVGDACAPPSATAGCKACAPAARPVAGPRSSMAAAPWLLIVSGGALVGLLAFVFVTRRSK